MEVCGTHTMAIARAGLKALLPPGIKLISGPGCPVCVTDQSYIDQAVWLAMNPSPSKGEGRARVSLPSRQHPQSPRRPDLSLQGRGVQSSPIIATYGDMVRVPGSAGSLALARSRGARVEVVVSTDQAVELAIANPDRQVVFLAVGFETTAPCTALAVLRARREGVKNFSVLMAHKWIMPAMHALLAGGGGEVDGFLCPGHVSVIIGYGAYESLVTRFARPCVVAGFEAGQILAGIGEILRQLSEGKPSACTAYPVVRREGSASALATLSEVFEPCLAVWRALGPIPESGMALRAAFADFDAAKRFDLPAMPSAEPRGCRCGDVILGRCEPAECGLFAVRCSPRDPVGPCMVSSEGACAAAYKYGRFPERKLEGVAKT